VLEGAITLLDILGVFFLFYVSAKKLRERAKQKPLPTRPTGAAFAVSSMSDTWSCPLERAGRAGVLHAQMISIAGEEPDVIWSYFGFPIAASWLHMLLPAVLS
jgi:hypothetical protein